MLSLMLRFLRGFSLVETLLVVSLISILGAAIIAGLGIPDVLARSRNAERISEINDLLGAIQAYTIDQDGKLPPATSIPSILTPATFSGARVVGTLKAVRTVAVGDLSGDAKEDILAATEEDDGEVSFWERGGSAPNFTWTKRQIDDDFEGWEVAIGNIDGVGLADVAAVSKKDKKVSWWSNNGGGSFGARVDIDTNYKDARAVNVADIDGDGDLDVVAASDKDKSVRWYRNNGTPTTGNWAYKAIDPSEKKVTEVITVDIDGDGDPDVLGGFDDNIYLWQNPRPGGDPFTGSWTRYRIDGNTKKVDGVYAANIDADADLDVVAISRNSGIVAWWENKGVATWGSDWTEHSVSASFGGNGVAAVDLDKDGDLDIAAVSEGGDKVAWWQNLSGGTSWSATTIIATEGYARGAIDLAVTDMDADADADLVVASRNAGTTPSGRLVWFENLRLTGTSPSAPTANITSLFKPICRETVTEAQCDANGGARLSVLVPGFIGSLPIDPSSTDLLMTGYEIRLEDGTPSLSLRAPLAEMGKTILLQGSVGTENCLIWDVLGDTRECIVYE